MTRMVVFGLTAIWMLTGCASLGNRIHGPEPGAQMEKKSTEAENAVDVDHLLELWEAQLTQDSSKAALERVRAAVKSLYAQGSADACAGAYLAAKYLLGDDTLAERWLAETVKAFPHHEAVEGLAKTELDAIAVERDDAQRLEMSLRFQRQFPASQYLAGAVDYELGALEQMGKASELEQRARFWAARFPDDPRVLKAVVDHLLEAGLAVQWCSELAHKALALVIEGSIPFLDPSESVAQAVVREVRFRITLIQVLIARGMLDAGLVEIDKALKILPSNDEGLEAALQWLQGQCEEKLGNRDWASAAYLRSVCLGAPRNRWAGPALTALEELIPAEDLGDWSRRTMRYAGEVFDDVTDAMGLGGLLCSRVAWGDADGDGFEDILLDGSVLMKNVRGERFENITAAAGLKAGSCGGLWADVDNDGDLDMFAMARGGAPELDDRLYLNNGTGRFEAVLPCPVADRWPTEGAGWGDFDGDGWVDLYVANYEMPVTDAQPVRGLGTPDYLYRNLGDGRFEDVTVAAGIVPPDGQDKCGRGVSWGDFDGDGDQDIFVSNYRLHENFLWENTDGQFENTALAHGVAGVEVDGYYGHTIGSVWGDADNDDDLDLFSANLAHPRYIEFSDKSMFLINGGAPDWQFTDQAAAAGIRYDETHSNPAFGDVDNDGDLDLVITSIYAQERSYLYLQTGAASMTFQDVTFLAGVRAFNGWGCAFADFDRDGDLDLLFGSHSGVRLFRNRGNDHHWIEIRVTGTRDNAAGIGAVIWVEQAGETQMRQVAAGSGTASQDSLIQHFGLGESSSPVTVTVRYPSGQVQILQAVAPDQRVVVRQE